jgi:four helix bundle protein
MKRDLDDRLRKFVQRILNLAKHLRTIPSAERIADQISRSGPSIRFNYAESQAASCRAHFISIIETTERGPARETQAALETIIDAEFVKPKRLTSLYQESSEIVAIITTIAKRAKENQQKQKNARKERKSHSRR